MLALAPTSVKKSAKIGDSPKVEATLLRKCFERCLKLCLLVPTSGYLEYRSLAFVCVCWLYVHFDRCREYPTARSLSELIVGITSIRSMFNISVAVGYRVVGSGNEGKVSYMSC
jgi:hypothetical protein